MLSFTFNHRGVTVIVPIIESLPQNMDLKRLLKPKHQNVIMENGWKHLIFVCHCLIWSFQHSAHSPQFKKKQLEDLSPATFCSAHQHSSTDPVTFAIQVITDLATKLGPNRGLIRLNNGEHGVFPIRNPDAKLDSSARTLFSLTPNS